MILAQRPVVLLARPHPMIVTEMRSFLDENGYEPLPLSNLAERPETQGRPIAAGVISTSLTSQVREPVEEVALRLREWYPDLPLVIATIAERQMIARAVARKLCDAVGTVAVLDVLEVSPADARLGSPEHVLLLHRSDLSGERSAEVGGVLRRHLTVSSSHHVTRRAPTVRV